MKFIISLKIGAIIITISKNDKIKENYNMKNDKNQNVQICKQKLWNLINNTLRNSVDTTIFKDYILPLLSFRYLSIKFEKDICKTTILGSLEKYKQAWDKWDSNEQSRFKNNIKGFCGFHIEPQYLWANLNNSINQDNFSFVAIDKALKSIESHCFKGLFENFDLTEKSKLGNEEEKNTKLKTLITGIDNIFFR
ncbi:hypothetical protein PAWBP_1340 [Paulownia witches'-broom phytoplasma]|nr:hypothetical protein PAWBP_1340 [Paulownia witches'-broom phytoplasma]